MAEMQDSWKEVAGKAEALGLKLKLHLAQEKTEEADGEAEATDSADTKAMIDDLGRKVQEAFDSAGNAAKDPAVHEDVKEMGRLLKDALLATVSTVGHEVRTRVDGAAGKSDDGVVDVESEVDTGEDE